ncbi:MAG: CHAD domain-containing protein [Ignavibacteria bacterium]|nr:CHAD domain-containing protein [Ignavibacteria bacterium]
MVINFLYDYFLSLNRNAFRLARSVSEKFAKKDIHDFRLEIKKLNAFALLLNFVLEENICSASRFESLYKNAGIIRNFSLLKSRLKRCNSFSEKIRQEFKKKKSLAKKEFIKHFSDLKKFFERKRYIFRIELSDGKAKEKLDEYLQIMNGELKNFSLKAGQQNFKYHDLRKKLKEYYYNYQVITDALLISQNPALLNSIENLNETLGKWHNKVMLLKRIRRMEIHCGQKNLERLKKAKNRHKLSIIAGLREFDK